MLIHKEKKYYLDDNLYRTYCCFAWNLKFVQGMTYKQCARVLGVSSAAGARKLALRYESMFDSAQQRQNYDDRAFERDIANGLFVWKPLIISEAAALNNSLNPC